MTAASDQPALIYTTFGSLEDAERVGEALVAAKLAACVNIFPAMTSIYSWKGEMQKDAETAMLIKTRKSLADLVMAETKSLHPYETPALLALDVSDVDTDYCAWLFRETEGGSANADPRETAKGRPTE